MIVIICAMSEERDSFLSLMKETKLCKLEPLKYHGMAFDNKAYKGLLGNKEVVIVHAGVGKVYAAIVTTLAIKKFKPELVINVGCAGSLNEDVHVGDCVVASRVADWEVDVPDWERSLQSDKMSFACDGRFNKLLNQLKLNFKVICGPIVSSDQFIYNKSQLKIIKKYFKEALAGEMEGAAIANTCYAFNVNCVIIRSISDETLINGNYQQFEFNLNKACANAATLTKKILEKY